MNEDVKLRIKEIMERTLPGVGYEDSDSLVDDGILDSLSIVTLISELSMEFGIIFDLDELTPENLNSIGAISETIERLQGAK